MPRNSIAFAASLRHSREEVQTWTERLANLREDLTLRQDTSGDKFRIELDKQTLDNRGVAGELLLRRAEKIKTRFGEDIRIGRFAGFDLFIRSGFNNTAELVLRGKNSYSTRVTDTALGTIRSLESTVQGFEERVGRLESDIKDSQKRATELEAKVGSPFEKEERYHKLVTRQSEIEEQLDLTKNQAPSQVDAAATDEREENSEKQTETKSNRQTRTGCGSCMNALNSNAEPTTTTVISLPKWLEQIGVTHCTAWRWRKKGWLKTINIAGRQYLTQDAIDEFQRRAAAGEFAQTHKVPTRK